MGCILGTIFAFGVLIPVAVLGCIVAVILLRDGMDLASRGLKAMTEAPWNRWPGAKR